MEITINTELKSHFLRLYQIACADENFAAIEMKQLYKFAEQRGIAAEYLNNILLNPVHQMEIPSTVEKKIEYLYDLAIMIWADEKITEDEYNLLKKYCKTFEFLPENTHEICDYLIECAKQQKDIQEILSSLN